MPRPPSAAALTMRSSLYESAGSPANSVSSTWSGVRSSCSRLTSRMSASCSVESAEPESVSGRAKK